jgi:hypothetical protein
VDGEPRYHLDIETDDVAAETARLVAFEYLSCQHEIGLDWLLPHLAGVLAGVVVQVAGVAVAGCGSERASGSW